ncbi:hypothetical protein [Phenylobacterium sp.]|uniref:hypothetical protein n=1 Tax=Phenylobacterium sp. TaxID=1871053 RepID=UPI002F3EC4DA
MGSLHTPPLSGLVRGLQRKHELQTFVETGTYLGGSTEFAAGVFPRVVTIEINPQYHEVAAARLQPFASVTCRLGDSRTELPQVVSALEGPALFWLDGHAGVGQYGDTDDCPLIEELAAIAASPFEHFVLIDDARAFLAPPPPPFDPDRWPELAEVLSTIRQRTAYYCVVIGGVMICAPPAARADIRHYCNLVRPKI